MPRRPQPGPDRIAPMPYNHSTMLSLPHAPARPGPRAPLRLRPWLRLLCAVLLSAPLLLPAPGRALEPHVRCEICQRDWDISPSRMRFSQQAGKRRLSLRACSPYCMLQRAKRHPDAPPEDLSIIDYSTMDEKEPRWAPAKHAHYVAGFAGDAKLAQEPFVVACARKENAEKLQQELGGKVLDWDGVLKLCTAWEREHQPAPKSNPRSGPHSVPRKH